MGKKFLTNNDHIVERLSRWITIKTNYNPKKTNSLYYYVRDENGYKPNEKQFNPSNGLFLDYFNWNNQTWAIEQFLLLGGVWGGGTPETFIDTDGKLSVIGAYDANNYHNPIMIETDEYGERVRVYREINVSKEELELFKIEHNLK